MTDIIDQIDAVIGCQQCGQPLGGSPSDDFCSEPCQSVWHGGRSIAMALPTDHSDYRAFVRSILDSSNPQATLSRLWRMRDRPR